MDDFFSNPLEMIQYRTLQGELVEIQSPSYYIDSDDFDIKLDNVCREITVEFEKRRLTERETRELLKAGGLSEAERGALQDRKAKVSPLQWLKPVCYQLILSFLNGGFFDSLEQRAKNAGRRVGGPKVKRNIFNIGIMAIFAHAKSRRGLAFLTEMQRQRLARQMWFAFRHYIPSQLINGFNEQYSFHDSKRKFKDDYLAPELASWITGRVAVEALCNLDFEGLRGSYPPDLSLKIEAALARVESLMHAEATATRRRKNEEDDW